MPPVDSADTGVSEEDVLSMFDKDGDLRDETQGDEQSSTDEDQEEEQEEEENDEDQDEEEQEEGDEDSEDDSEEDEEEEEEEEPEAQLDWSKIPAEHRAAFEASQKEVTKLRKDYGKLHSKFTQLSQSRREEDQDLPELRARAQQASEWEAILEQHPELQGQIVDLIKKARGQAEPEIPEELKSDPAVQLLLQREQRLMNEIRQMRQETAPLKEWQKSRADETNRKTIDGILDEAKAKYKAMFKSDMDEDKLTQVLKYIVENEAYGNPKKGHKGAGTYAVLEVFGKEYEKALSNRDANRLRDKAKKFGARNKTVNSRQAASAPKISSERDAITAALAEQGLSID